MKDEFIELDLSKIDDLAELLSNASCINELFIQAFRTLKNHISSLEQDLDDKRQDVELWRRLSDRYHQDALFWMKYRTGFPTKVCEARLNRPNHLKLVSPE